jgi:hypothetical protein
LAAEAWGPDPDIDASIDIMIREHDEAKRTDRAIRADVASQDPWLPEHVVGKLRQRKRRR